jgi:Spy/CpxP family protein refolding chaperone
MKTTLAWACAALLLASTPGQAAEACDATQQQQQKATGQGHQKGTSKRPDQPAPEKQGPRKWWTDAEMRAELNITDQQSAEIEKVWQKSFAQRAETRERLDKLDAVLQKMILDAADEAAVTAQLDRVEAARVEANKARVLMLYRMNRLLTQDQRLKLDAKAKAMRDQRDRGRRGGPGSR